MTLLARATRVLEPLDSSVNRLADIAIRYAPWGWWPVSPPRRDCTYEVRHHAVYLAWSIGGFFAGEALTQRMPEEYRSTGRQLRIERGVVGMLTIVVWAASAGAWNRRAARLRRRPWHRLYGR